MKVVKAIEMTIEVQKRIEDVFWFSLPFGK